MTDRAQAYASLCSHYRRWLAQRVRMELERIPDLTDEKIQAIPPKTWRAVASTLIDEADRADRECMAVWHVPEDKLDEFVRVRTHPELEQMMLDQFGLKWNPHFMNWEEA